MTDVSISNDKKVVAIKGELDTISSADAETRLYHLISDFGATLTLDLAELSYISSSGLRILLGIKKRFEVAGGSLKLVNMNEMVAKVFEITGLDKLFK